MKTRNQAIVTAAENEDRGQDSKLSEGSKKIHLLSIGSVERSYALSDALLEKRRSSCSTRLDCRELWMIPNSLELWVIPGQETFDAAILQDTLPLLELDEACRFIRRQWPSARILVIRTGDNFLDDTLYDDRVLPSSSTEVLITAIERLLKGQHESRSRVRSKSDSFGRGKERQKHVK
jgi:hypothetical protein